MIDIFCTCTRCPITNCTSIVLEFHTKISTKIVDILKCINEQKYVIYKDVVYPSDVLGRNEVFVSRLRPKSETEFHCFIVFDNLYRGSSLNSCEIAEELIRND